MSLNLKFNVLEETNSLILIDCTGDYSNENKGGWGGPNPKRSDVTSSVMEIEGPWQALAPNFNPVNTVLSSNQQNFVPPNPTGQPVGAIVPIIATLNLLDKFPNSKDYGYEIFPSMIPGLNGNIKSGKYTFRWTVEGAYTSGIKFKRQTLWVGVFMNNVFCCVDKQLPKTDLYAFKDPKQRAFIEMSNFLDAACLAKKCGNYEKADEIIQYLNQQCVCTTC